MFESSTDLFCSLESSLMWVVNVKSALGRTCLCRAGKLFCRDLEFPIGGAAYLGSSSRFGQHPSFERAEVITNRAWDLLVFAADGAQAFYFSLFPT